MGLELVFASTIIGPLRHLNALARLHYGLADPVGTSRICSIASGKVFYSYYHPLEPRSLYDGVSLCLDDKMRGSPVHKAEHASTCSISPV